jgi:uncharacterized protein
MHKRPPPCEIEPTPLPAWSSNDMKPPLITATYVAILALLYTLLTLQVVRLRRRYRVGFGDGENAALRCAIRAHAHFAEYVPIIALMAAMLEMSGLAATRNTC